MFFGPVSFKAGRRALIGFLIVYGTYAPAAAGIAAILHAVRQQLHTRYQLPLSLPH